MRVFVAVEVENQEVLESIKKIQTNLNVRANPVSLKNIHFTLLFLGEISEDQLEYVKTALKSIEFSSFEVQFLGVGAFPKMKFPRVIWVGTDKDGRKNLEKLAYQVEEKLSPFGFRSDKAFKPHITIFRVKNKIGDISNELKELKTTSFGIQTVSELKLKQSVLKPEGPQYSDLLVIKARS